MATTWFSERALLGVNHVYYDYKSINKFKSLYLLRIKLQTTSLRKKLYLLSFSLRKTASTLARFSLVLVDVLDCSIISSSSFCFWANCCRVLEVVTELSSFSNSSYISASFSLLRVGLWIGKELTDNDKPEALLAFLESNDDFINFSMQWKPLNVTTDNWLMWSIWQMQSTGMEFLAILSSFG